jgi:anti-sigma regulatory factor (Ser/Thr protein kinase)
VHSLTVPAVLDSLAAIADFVRKASVAAGLDKKALYNLRLAVDEIATNVILYGFEKAGLAGDITVMADIRDDTLMICLEDTASPYDPRGVTTEAQDALDKPLEERPMGGLGIFLALKSVDQFHYERAHDRNRNIFVMNRQRLSGEQ